MNFTKRLKKFLKPHWQYRDTVTVLFIFCILIATSSWLFGRAQLGKSNDDLVEQLKIVFPILATTLIFAAPLLISFYIKAQVEQDVAKEREEFVNTCRKLRARYANWREKLQEDFQRDIDALHQELVNQEKKLQENFQRDLDALHQEFRMMTSEGIFLQQEMEYVSAIAQAFLEGSEGFSIDQINISALSQSNERKIISSSTTIEELLVIDKEAVGRHLALTALLSNRGEEVLVQIARKALKVVLPQSENDLDNIAYKNFFLDIYAYLKAWLVCSLANRCYMRVDVIKQRYPSKAEPEKKYYINALNHIKDAIFNGKQINTVLFGESNDIEVIEAAKGCIRKHLQYLIDQIENSTISKK